MLHVDICVCMWGVGLHQERFQKLLARILEHIFAFSPSPFLRHLKTPCFHADFAALSNQIVQKATLALSLLRAKILGLSLSRIKDSYPIQLTNPLPFGEKSE